MIDETAVIAKKIPYFSLAESVFSEKAKEGQAFIPFLGAGVSVSGRTFRAEKNLTSPPPERTEIDNALACLRLKGKGKIFTELAILLGYLIELEEAEAQFESKEEFKQRLQDEPYPPSASELAQLFGRFAEYSTFVQLIASLRRRFPEQLLTADEEEQVAALQLLSQVTRIANPPEPLTSITSYYEKLLGRPRLWELLTDVFKTKKVPTQTHRLLAEAAKYHLTQPDAIDYLIITSNYDCLMENALDELAVPYIVLTTKRGNDPTVLIRCANNVPQRERLEDKYHNKLFPINFQIQKSKSLVIIYKIHGCLNVKPAEDGVVISDNDYVGYVSQMARNNGVIPAHVSELMREKQFWYLGYSLSDWNVRSIYETLKSRSSPDGKQSPDYSVMRSVGDFEKLFFSRNNITIFQADLNEFVQGIVGNLPARVRSCPYPKQVQNGE